MGVATHLGAVLDSAFEEVVQALARAVRLLQAGRRPSDALLAWEHLGKSPQQFRSLIGKDLCFTLCELAAIHQASLFAEKHPKETRKTPCPERKCPPEPRSGLLVAASSIGLFRDLSWLQIGVARYKDENCISE